MIPANKAGAAHHHPHPRHTHAAMYGGMQPHGASVAHPGPPQVMQEVRGCSCVDWRPFALLALGKADLCFIRSADWFLVLWLGFNSHTKIGEASCRERGCL